MATKKLLKKVVAKKAPVKTAPLPPKSKTPAKPEPLNYDAKVALAEKARKEWLKFDDDDLTKADVKDFLNKYMGQLGYKPLCKAIRGMEVLVKKPKGASDDDE